MMSYHLIFVTNNGHTNATRWEALRSGYSPTGDHVRDGHKLFDSDMFSVCKWAVRGGVGGGGRGCKIKKSSSVIACKSRYCSLEIF